ncbi:MAG: aldehyde dehydrogenase family protein [Rubrobacteraceae bacterium]|jgi:aldehyde dehydrogenase (NAD+)|nr:aldehyde dehydrogenase family protein [Rubrobacter sp.]
MSNGECPFISCIYLEGADLDRAASAIAYAAMGYAGQKCTATSRVIVEETVYEELRDRLVAAVEGMEIVDPEKETTQVGPLIDNASRSSALEVLDRSGGRIVTGGKPLDDDGFYLEPTLVEVDDTDNALTREEVFAPIAAMFKADSAEEALCVANGVRYGLVAAVFTDNLERAMAFADRLETGLVRVNAATSGVDFHVPFGGAKDSGIGFKEQGLAARDFYTETRTVLVSP